VHRPGGDILDLVERPAPGGVAVLHRVAAGVEELVVRVRVANASG